MFQNVQYNSRSTVLFVVSCILLLSFWDTGISRVRGSVSLLSCLTDTSRDTTLLANFSPTSDPYPDLRLSSLQIYDNCADSFRTAQVQLIGGTRLWLDALWKLEPITLYLAYPIMIKLIGKLDFKTLLIWSLAMSDSQSLTQLTGTMLL